MRRLFHRGRPNGTVSIGAEDDVNGNPMYAKLRTGMSAQHWQPLETRSDLRPRDRPTRTDSLLIRGGGSVQPDALADARVVQPCTNRRRAARVQE